MKQFRFYTFFAALFFVLKSSFAVADGIVSGVISAPVFANGILSDERSGINILLQTDRHKGLDFFDPNVTGYGIPPGGSMEVEMVAGFERDPKIALDDKSLLLTVGAPQQGLPDDATGHQISQGDNPNTFKIIPVKKDGLLPDKLVSPAPGARLDPVPLRGIKIVHVGRTSAFISRGDVGLVEVRIKDSGGNIVARGSGKVNFLQKPGPQVFLTNIPHNQRNHNWQRVKPGQIVGSHNNTLPLSLLLFAKNEGLGKIGIENAGVLSVQQLVAQNFALPLSMPKDLAALILRDANADQVLDPNVDEVIGLVRQSVPAGAVGQQLVTPIVGEKLFLSKNTSAYNERAGKTVGGSILQVVYVTGDKPGIYRLAFSLFSEAGNMTSELSPPAFYTVVAE